MKRTFTKYPSGYVKASSGLNDYPTNWNKISAFNKKHYRWSGSKFLGTDIEGNEYFTVEGEPDNQFFRFCLVRVEPEGNVAKCDSRTIEQDSYTTERAMNALSALESTYRDYYAE